MGNTAITTQKTERDSSLELLRIVAMLMIIAHHFACHGGFYFHANSIMLNRLWHKFIFMGGSLGNDIFVMLSGYFLINSKVLNLRRLFNLWARIFFYSVIIYSLFLTVGHEKLSLKTALDVLMPLTRNYNRQWWFASIYLMMYLVHPYINRLIHTFTREEYRKFLILIGLCWCVIPALTNSDFGANNTINFVCLYCFAGYVRLYADDFRNRNYILCGAALIGINFLSAYVLDTLGQHHNYFFGMMGPFTVLAALCLLIGFRNLNIKYHKDINTIASATFGVYLIHDNIFVRPFIWLEFFRNASFQNSPYLIPYSLAVILIVYSSCTILELLRSKIFKTLTRGYLS